MKKNSEYDEYATRWKKCRAFASGDEHEIKELATSVLPMLKGELKEDYQKRVDFAHIDNKVSASMRIYRGMAFRKNPVITSKVTDKHQVYIDNIDGNSTNVFDFAKKLHAEHLTVTRYGILIDADEAMESESVEAYRQRGGRAKACFYSAESIIDWNTEGGQYTYVALKENEKTVIFDTEKNQFETINKETYRTLDILNGKYRVMLWEVDDFGELLLIDTKELNDTVIPFKIFPDAEIVTPMIMSLVDANIAHFKTDVMDANLCRLIATPTPVFSGFTEFSDPQKPKKINLSEAIATQNPAAKWGYLEMNGAGASAIQARLARLLDEMIAEGSSFLRESPKGVESAETASIHAIGDNSKLTEVSISVETAINWAMDSLLAMDNVASEPFKIELNRDMLPYAMSAQERDSIVRSLISGAISEQTAFYLMQKGEQYPEGWTLQDEQDAIGSKPLL